MWIKNLTVNFFFTPNSTVDSQLVQKSKSLLLKCYNWRKVLIKKKFNDIIHLIHSWMYSDPSLSQSCSWNLPVKFQAQLMELVNSPPKLDRTTNPLPYPPINNNKKHTNLMVSIMVYCK